LASHFLLLYPRSPKGEGGILFYLCPSQQLLIAEIWYLVTSASYGYPILWEAFLDPSDSYSLFADFFDFYTHLTYICICTFFVAFFSATIDGRNLIFGHKLHIGTLYRGKRFWTRQIPTLLFAEKRGYHKWAKIHLVNNSS
jgi:hypothetical protein